MTAVAMTVKLLSLLVALTSAAARAEPDPTDCSSSLWSYEEFSEKLKISDECMEALAAQWTEHQNASILNDLIRLTDILKKKKKSVCKDAPPKKCPVPAVHTNGGMVCVSAKEERYCKPMCNEGCDFTFLRISRLYEGCSNATRHKWTTQFVGGNKLAVCNKSTNPMAGASSAYFPLNQDCWTTKSSSTLTDEIIMTFEHELSARNIRGPYTDGCLMCG